MTCALQNQGAPVMIREIAISNFKCFRNQSLRDLDRVNIILGQNASGKTALLESIFIAAGFSPEVAQRIKAWRSGDQSFLVNNTDLDRYVWRDLFHMFDMKKSVEIDLTGTDDHTRGVKIDYDVSKVFAPVAGTPGLAFESPIQFTYTEPNREPAIVKALVSVAGFQFSGIAGSGLQATFFSANHQYPGQENVDRFSRADLAGRGQEVTKAIAGEFGFIRNLSILSEGGLSALHVESPWFPTKVPLSVVSTGVNKFITIILAIVSTPGGLVMVDEIENGFHHSRLASIWRTLIALAREHNVQIFASTHSWECLEALREASKDDDGDIRFVRMSTASDGVKIEQFRGDTILGAVERDREVRT